MIIDDHPLVAEGIAGLLAEFGEAITTEVVAAGRAGIDHAIAAKPDLILLDLHMPEIDGFAALEILGESLPTTTVVVVSGSLQKSDMERAIGMGAAGYIPKSASPNIMRNALQLVMSGGMYLPPEMLSLSMSADAHAQTASIASNSGPSLPHNVVLTPRQLEVLGLLSEGKVNKEIARLLDCAETTVKAHIRAVFKELNARNRTEAVVNAKKLGVID